MRTVHLLASVVLLAAGLAAQTTSASLETATPVGVFAKAGTMSNFQFIKQGTKIMRPVRVTAHLGRTVVASTLAGMRHSMRAAAANVTETGAVRRAGASAGTSASSNPKSFTPGPHSFLFRVGARQGRKLRIVAVYVGRVAGRGTKAGGAVDIGNNGKVDFSAAADGKVHKMQFDVTAGMHGVVIKLTTHAIASASAAGYGGTLTAMVADVSAGNRCTFTRFGASCGPLLAGREQTTARGTVVTFITAHAKPNALAAFLMGAARQAVRIPGTRCFLNVKPILFFPRKTSARGTATISFPVPKAFAGRIETQDVILFRARTGVGIQSTNGLTLTCKKGQ